MRVLSYRPRQLADSTYSGVNSMTWSIVEQGIGIVCACLPTLRPLLLRLRPSYFSSRTNDTKDSGKMYGMDNFHSRQPSTIPRGQSAWKSNAGFEDSESTVGFAKLKDDDLAMPLSAADVQRTVYAPLPVGSAVTTNAKAEPEKRNYKASAEILKETTIDQKSEVLPNR